MNLEPRLSSTVRSLPPSGIRRFFDMANELRGQVISLSIGEPDFVTPWSVREAGIYSLERGHTHYSPNQGFLPLREAVCEYQQRRFDLAYDPMRQAVITVGGSEAIDLCVRALIDPGDEVIIPEPCFVAYQACVRLAGGVPVTLPCLPEDDFKLTAAQLEGAITPRTKLVMLGYPNNPTGAVLPAEELEAIAAVIAKHDLIALSDELYAELTYAPAKHRSLASFPGLKERTVLVGGFSKAFAMTGWRIGYALGPEPILAAMNKIHQYAIMSSPTTAQDAAIEALRQADELIEPMRNEYNRRRRYVLSGCRDAGLECFEPLGAFYVFPHVGNSGLDSTAFCESFLQEEKVAIVPGSAFGQAGEGHVRISYAASMENIQEAMRRLKRFMAKRGSHA